MRVRNRLVEQEVRATVDEDRQHLQLFGDRTERRRIAARRDAAEEVDLLLEFQPAQLLDVAVDTGSLVRLEHFDLALAEETSGRIDLFRCEYLSLVHRFAEHCGGTSEKGHVSDLVRRARNIAFGRLCLGHPDKRNRTRRGTQRHTRADAKTTQEIPTIDLYSHVCLLQDSEQLQDRIGL